MVDAANLEAILSRTRAFELTNSPQSSSLTVPETRLDSTSLISIILCTRNRAEKLSRTLSALGSLNLPLGWDAEFIVVDNGSTDATHEICESARQNLGQDLQRVFLATPGLGRARNAGIKMAKGSIFAFTDDDVLPEKNWLEIIIQEFRSDPDLSIVSGRVELFNPKHLPVTVRRGTVRADCCSLADSFSLLVGCNFAVRRAVVERVGAFDPEFGAGSRFVSAEDADFFYRAWRSGEKLCYAPEMLVYHDHGRETAEAELKLFYWYISGRGAFYAKHICLRDILATRNFYWELRSSLIGSFRSGEKLGWRHPAWLLKGFLSYLGYRFFLRPNSTAENS